MPKLIQKNIYEPQISPKTFISSNNCERRPSVCFGGKRRTLAATVGVRRVAAASRRRLVVDKRKFGGGNGGCCECNRPTR